MATQPVDKDSIRRFIDLKVDKSFLDSHGANACAVGTRDNTPCITLYVDVEKHPNPNPLGVNKVAQSIPFDDPVTKKRIEIPIKVVAAGATRSDKQAGNAVAEPVPGGVGINVPGEGRREKVSNATLGGWAWDQRDDSLVFISNAHVLGTDADRLVFYPAIGMEKKPFGKTKRGVLHQDKKNRADSAIGVATDPSRAALKVKGLGPAIMAIAAGQIGDTVAKMGYGTNRTEGTIADDWWTGVVPDLAGIDHLFGPCLLIDPGPQGKWADEGDSGSLVFRKNADETRTVVGLHFGRHKLYGRWFGVVSPIHAAFADLDITTLPGGILASIVASAAGTKGQAFADMMQVLAAFKDVCATTPQGRRLLSVLDTHRLELVAVLATDAKLMAAAPGVLRALFGGVKRLDEAMQRPVTHDAVQKIREFGELLRQEDDDLRPRVEACLGDLPETPENTTLNAILNVPIPAGHL